MRVFRYTFLLTMFLMVKSAFAAGPNTPTPPVLKIFVYPDVLEFAINKHFSIMDRSRVAQEWENRMDANGMVTQDDIRAVCKAGRIDDSKCREFQKDITTYFYDVCEKSSDKGKSDCIKDFWATVWGTWVRLPEAIGISKEYALVKHKEKVVCSTSPKNVNPPARASYIKCTSVDGTHFYTFKYNSTSEKGDRNIINGTLRAIGKIHDVEFDQPDCTLERVYSDSNCAFAYKTSDAAKCEKINKSLKKFGSEAKIFKTERFGTRCEVLLGVAAGNRTAYGIDNKVFKDVQISYQENLEQRIKTYVQNELKRQNIRLESFSCDSSTSPIYSRSDLTGLPNSHDEILTCYVNGKPIDFLFSDLSQRNGWKKRGSEQAMDCIISGGTYTGKRCTNLDQQQCEMLRNANLKTCPECKDIYWDTKNGVCSLPNSTVATNIKKGIKVVAIVAGATVGVVITIGTGGLAGATAGSYAILAVETTGAGIEIWAQHEIDGLADEFFVKANNCNSDKCAAQLIETYLTDLAAIERDLTIDEAEAIDKEMARLIELIPTNSEWWINSLRMEDGKSLLESNDDGHWTAAQVWRAIGIGMQFAGVAASVTKWVLKKTGYLTKTLDRTSKILEKNAEIARKNFVGISQTHDEWYKLWREYAPQNQTLDQFKAMANGDINEMRQMVKNWTPRSESTERLRNIYQQLATYDDELDDFEKLMKRYGIDEIPTDPAELQKLYNAHPDFKAAHQSLVNQQVKITMLKDERDLLAAGNYSTFDPEFSRIAKSYTQQIDDLTKQFDADYQAAFAKYRKTHKNATEEEFKKSSYTYKIMLNRFNKQYGQIVSNFQWQVAEQFPLQNIDNIVNSRSVEMLHITNDPQIRASLDNWDNLSNEDRISLAQLIMNRYAQETGTPLTRTTLETGDFAGAYDSDINTIIFNPEGRALKTTDDMLEVSAHEQGHMIDHLQPNDGALGEQYAHYANNMYSSGLDDGYRVSLTEQSSYKISEGISGRSQGVGLEKNIDKTLIPAVTIPAGVGVLEGGINNLIDYKDRRSIFEKYNDEKNKRKPK